MRYDTLIVGAGMSGLAAGIRLAQAGGRVAILERHYLWGGLNSFFKLGGHRFDTGLHALTNFFRRGERGSPLARVLRALRIERDALELCEPTWSQVAFQVGGDRVRLRFSNDLDLLRSEVARAFPASVDAFERLLESLPGYDSPRLPEPGARARLLELVADPLLREMLLCPVAFYGSAREDDMDWDAFGVIFRSLFVEGIARPAGGIRALLDLLRGRFLEEGGELRLRCGVRRLAPRAGAVAVELDDGSTLEARQVLSSAGLVETLELLGRPVAGPGAPPAGRISVLETVSVLDRASLEAGHAATLGFYNVGERFRYRAPDAPCDVASGVTCSPDNYRGQSDVPEGRLRVTVLASPERWLALDPPEYATEKARWSERALDAAAPFAFDPRPFEVFRDTFTPRTIRRFTGHAGGALYGSPDKRRRGDLGVEGVRLIGNDEGYVGIVGALASGVAVANQAALAAPPASLARGGDA